MPDLPDLEEELEQLKELDRLRVKSATLRDRGYEYLDRWLAASRDPSQKVAVEAVGKHAPMIARVLLEQNLRDAGESVDEDREEAKTWTVTTIADLEKRTLEDLGDRDWHVIEAAEIAEVLTAAPSSAFSPCVLYCYYLLIRELNTPYPPHWSAGGATLGREGLSSAFATGKCVRALLGFARAQTNTAKLLRALGKIRRQARLSDSLPAEWREAEDKRLSWSIYTTLRLASANLAVRMHIEDLEDARRFIADAADSVRGDIESAKEVFLFSAKEIERSRAAEWRKARKSKSENEFERSRFGHNIALQAIQRAAKNAIDALSILGESGSSSFEDWDKLAEAFEDAASQVRGLLRPALTYLSGVLDREVFAALTGQQWDASELACAARAYGEADDRWGEERLVTAVTELGKAIGPDGRFPDWRPHHIGAGERPMYLYSGTLLGVIAELLEHVGRASLPSRLITRMIDFFDRTEVWANEITEAPGGWRNLWGRKADPGITASAVDALLALNRMLDQRINEMVLRHFTVRRPDRSSSEIDLESAFYPDYGMRFAPLDVRPEASVAIVLQQMRAHVAGIRVPQRKAEDRERRQFEETCRAVVLYGPPGTGKTTLLEALAASCEVPLVAVTPSDIVIRGEASIERRTRAVFVALSLLTHVVILLDEFDPVLWRRDPEDSSPRTVFSFLTPGMLPKLKELYRQAGRRRVAYALLTNLVGGLEPAAIREGRFDRRVGVYPPDPLSRAGRFLSELLAHQGSSNLSPVQQERALKVIVGTAGAPMPALGRKGWFVPPGSLRPGTPFHYVLHGGEEPVWPKSEARDYVAGKETIAKRENQQWLWIKEWEKNVKEREAEGSHLIEALAGRPPEAPPWQDPPKQERGAGAAQGAEPSP